MRVHKSRIPHPSRQLSHGFSNRPLDKFTPWQVDDKNRNSISPRQKIKAFLSFSLENVQPGTLIPQSILAAAYFRSISFGSDEEKDVVS